MTIYLYYINIVFFSQKQVENSWFTWKIVKLGQSVCIIFIYLFIYYLYFAKEIEKWPVLCICLFFSSSLKALARAVTEATLQIGFLNIRKLLKERKRKSQNNNNICLFCESFFFTYLQSTMHARNSTIMKSFSIVRKQLPWWKNHGKQNKKNIMSSQLLFFRWLKKQHFKITYFSSIFKIQKKT